MNNSWKTFEDFIKNAKNYPISDSLSEFVIRMAKVNRTVQVLLNKETKEWEINGIKFMKKLGSIDPKGI